MIVASLLLIVVAVVLLAGGLLGSSNTYLVGSILTSLLAAVALIMSSRRTAQRPGLPAQRSGDAAAAESGRRHARHSELVGAGVGGGAGAGAGGRRPGSAQGPAVDEYGDRDEVVGSVRRRDDEQTAGIPDEPRRDIPMQGSASVMDDDDDEFDDDDPADEPAQQLVSPADAARVARLGVDVLVIDGRPRYHLSGCVHLLGRDHEPLPVSEAIELGFTPCALCEPDSALLATSRRV